MLKLSFLLATFRKEPYHLLSNISSSDGYAYEFNGQMKVNEWAGSGNWNTAKFWEYCTRTATRKDPDPIVNPSVSSYAVFDGSPILKSDELGDQPGWRNYIFKQLGAHGNDAQSATQWNNDVMIPTLKHVGTEVAINVTLLVLQEIAGEILGSMLMEETIAVDATRVAKPVYEPVPVIENSGAATIRTPNAQTVDVSVRANEIHSTLDPIAQSRRTTAVANGTTADGNNITLVSSSEKTLAPIQRAALRPGETAVSGNGHAEKTLVDYVWNNSVKLDNVAA